MTNTPTPIILIPLNKRISLAGICARRKAAILVKDGLIKVNGTIVKDPGHRVSSTDVIEYQKKIVPAMVQQPLYILLNKPRAVITTRSDENGRITVLDLLPKKLQPQLFPVGRLDKETTGLLLLTNDGLLANKLAHPRNKISKTYHVTLDRELPEAVLNSIKKGIYLSDGFICVDKIAYSTERDTSHVRITLHSGKNKIIKRLFEQFGFWVKKLDRTGYAGLSSNRLAQGDWRHLTAHEVHILKQITHKRT